MNINRDELDKLTLELKDDKLRSAAFSKIVEMLSKPIYWHIRKMVLSHDDADDLLQNTFLKAWQALDTFRGDNILIAFENTIRLSVHILIASAHALIVFENRTSLSPWLCGALR